MVADEGDNSVLLEAQRLQLVQQLPDVVIPVRKIPTIISCLNARAWVDSDNLCLRRSPRAKRRKNSREAWVKGMSWAAPWKDERGAYV